MKYITNSVLIATTVTLSLISPVTSFAQSTSPVATGSYGAKCTKIVNALNSRITNFNNGVSKADQRNDDIATRLKNIITYLQNHNDSQDATTLQGYLTVMHDQYGVQIHNDYHATSSQLQAAQAMANAGDCGKSGGKFLAAIAQARGDIQQLKNDVKARKDYWDFTIKPFLQHLKGKFISTPSTAPTQ